MKIKILLFALTLLSVACKNSKSTEPIDTPKTESQKLFQEIMQIHDAVMPKISDVHRQKRKLLKLIKHADGKYIIKEDINSSILFLDKADDSMMDWMAAFDSSKKNDSSLTSINYLKKQQKEISIISKLIHSSIVSAKKITDNVKISNK